MAGFPEDGGLSSHTATPLSSGEILILGREGSLRMQRRHGSGYLLSGSVESGKFTYREYTQETASRSGHTSNIIGNVLYVVGGRDNNLIEMHQGFKSPKSPLPVTNPITTAVDNSLHCPKHPVGGKITSPLNPLGQSLFMEGKLLMGEAENLWGRCSYFLGNPVLLFTE